MKLALTTHHFTNQGVAIVTAYLANVTYLSHTPLQVLHVHVRLQLSATARSLRTVP